MSERFVIVVTPPDKDHDSLTVEDAMQQVLDAFQLLISSSEADESVSWRLIEAKTNSPPFSVVGEARSTRHGIDVDLIAKNQKKAFANNYHKLQQGYIPEAWQQGKPRKIIEDFVIRNRNGVAKTRIELATDQVIEISQQEAALALEAFKKPITKEVKPRKQIGSIEGIIQQVGSYYSEPAICIIERLSGSKVWCLVDEKHRKQIADEADFEDVWSGRRVRIRGELEYNNVGELSKIIALDIEPINGRKVSINEIRDIEFTGGLKPSEYIDKLRDGDFD